MTLRYSESLKNVILWTYLVLNSLDNQCSSLDSISTMHHFFLQTEEQALQMVSLSMDQQSYFFNQRQGWCQKTVQVGGVLQKHITQQRMHAC